MLITIAASVVLVIGIAIASLIGNLIGPYWLRWLALFERFATIDLFLLAMGVVQSGKRTQLESGGRPAFLAEFFPMLQSWRRLVMSLLVATFATTVLAGLALSGSMLLYLRLHHSGVPILDEPPPYRLGVPPVEVSHARWLTASISFMTASHGLGIAFNLYSLWSVLYGTAPFVVLRRRLFEAGQGHPDPTRRGDRT